MITLSSRSDLDFTLTMMIRSESVIGRPTTLMKRTLSTAPITSSPTGLMQSTQQSLALSLTKTNCKKVRVMIMNIEVVSVGL